MKADAAAIGSFVENLAKQPWIVGTNRSRWPLHLFRIDDVQAAASILERGSIYSRNRALALGLVKHDAASPGIIENSPEWIKECVRFYFRPRTPTEYRSEGFRPKPDLEMGAHRPVPIVLVFEAIPILSATGTIFTSGNAATRGVERGDSATFLQTIPFQKVYHDGPLSESEKGDVVFRRCAEVLVRDELDLANLKHVLCRSQAEHETLLSLLSDAARASFVRRIGVSARVHYRLWTFLENVDLSSQRVTLRFSPPTRTPGPFRALMQLRDPTGQLIGRWEDKSLQANRTYTINLRGIDNPPSYQLSLTLDDALAYRGTHRASETIL